MSNHDPDEERDWIQIGGPISPRVRGLLKRYGFTMERPGEWSRPSKGHVEAECDIIMDAYEEDATP